MVHDLKMIINQTTEEQALKASNFDKFSNFKRKESKMDTRDKVIEQMVINQNFTVEVDVIFKVDEKVISRVE